MPEPVPAPTASEIVEVAEMTMLPTSAVLVMVSADEDQDISNAKWAKALEYIDAWPTIRDEAGDIAAVGSIKFFEGTNIKTRLEFRNRLRALYGQTLLVGESTSTLTSHAAPAAVSVGTDW